MRLMRKLVAAAILALGVNHAALAQTCPSSPYTLTNGTNADASQVMANFNNLLNCINSQPGLVFAPAGRLTLAIGTPVLTSTVSGAGTVYYTPYTGNLVPIWTGTGFVARTFTELSNILANSTAGNAGPAAATAGAVYDLFVWSNAGTVTLTRGPAWTTQTTRSSGTNLGRVNGILTNTVAITNGPAAGFGTYIGTIATDTSNATVSWNPGSAATGGGASWLGVWNAFNRVDVGAFVQDNTPVWTYTSSAFRSANNSNNNRVTFVTGISEDNFSATYSVRAQSPGVGGEAQIGIGLNSTTGPGSRSIIATVWNSVANAAIVTLVAPISDVQPIGVSYLQALERSDNTNTDYFYGVDVNLSMALAARLRM
ncbi:hypothetical protein SAMN05216304_10926 [Bosea sp. OK403]|uniref:hypothetical protein n=1 Tax=Bosea sp. OK403 TaxID=1855286 RepID=UPI0008F1184C|nr:hypothetical protein [Bosea sp. OK403]SFJ52025.1 hypothetical protein SAMN05216304_10926 [Bosea sp. OK403]